MRETLDDIASLLPTRRRDAIKEAMIRSIENRAKSRAKTVVHWVGQSEAFVDVRVYEGPMHDSATDATVETHQIRYRRVKPFAKRPLPGTSERGPKAHERIEAIMADTFDGSGKPGRIVTFVVGPFKALAIEGNEIFVE